MHSKGLFRTYQLGENDYYWLHSSVDTRFWIIPEEILYKYNYISNRGIYQKQLKITVVSEKTNSYGSSEWMRNYEVDYSNITDTDKERIVGFFA